MKVFGRSFHPRALVDSWLTYPRYLGTIKPELVRRSQAELEAWLRAMSVAWWAKALEIPLGKRILAISAHPDDETLGAGGFLIEHRGKARIDLISVFNGAGEEGLGGAAQQGELNRVGQGEYRAVAALLGAESVQSLNLADGKVKPNLRDAHRLYDLVHAIRPDVVLLPWFLDGQTDHRVTNVLYAWACSELDCAVLGFEIWTMMQPNAFLDITACFDQKLRLVDQYRSQTAHIDYGSLCQGMARLRAFQFPVRPNRGGAAEAFVALPNREYCELVTSIYGPPGRLSARGAGLL